MILPGMPAALALLNPQEQRGVFMSLYGMFTQIGMTLGPLLMGVVFGILGVGAVFYVSAAFSLATFALVALLIE